jgi:hypothetical protein
MFDATRRSVRLGFGAWVTPGVRPSAAFRLEHWSDGKEYLAAMAGGQLRANGDRLALVASAEHAVALSGGASYSRGAVFGTWASALGLARPSWSANLGFDWASAPAPTGTWPVVGANLPWAIQLRAHPLTSAGLNPAENTGQAIIHGGLATDRPVYRLGPLVLGVGLFLDGAEIGSPLGGSSASRFYLDGGAGIRIGIADGRLGALRIDLARGLVANRRLLLTVGGQQSLPTP